MTKFIFRTLIYGATTILLVYGIAMFGGPHTDPFYQRFTTPKQSSLIVGTSRAAQGLVPEVMNGILDSAAGITPLYNYSFTIKSSPYGEPYLTSILRKLKVTGAKNNVFIITIDPWSISTVQLKRDGEDENLDYKEWAYAPNNMSWVHHSPNPEYIFKNLDNRLLMVSRYFRHQGHPSVMNDGSLAIYAARDEAEFQQVLPRKLTTYREYAEILSLSDLRFTSFCKTLDTLSSYGSCFVVRLPVHPEMLAIENDYMPEFDRQIEKVANQYRVPYLNYVHEGSKFASTDGNHLTRKAALRFSKILAADIKKILLDSGISQLPGRRF